MKAEHKLRRRNPDVLTCIANLSNDEVFTPPDLARKMLDTLSEAWAFDHGDADIWTNKDVRFLDPCTKSGVFLREIASRLIKGLAKNIPDIHERVNHVLTKQVYGIATTNLTAMLARRSVYCSKSANGNHSVVSDFLNESGHIWFERIDHTWNGTKCQFCGALRSEFDRGDQLESYAYPFIHAHDINAWISEQFGGDMKFDVVIGNPPYQMRGGGGGSSDSSIYQKFVEQATELKPKYTSMVIPSRWLAGGRGLDDFRAEMLKSGEISTLVDYPASREIFPNVEVKGGICYFLRSTGKKYKKCNVTVIRGDSKSFEPRALDEFDVFIRSSVSVGILRKVSKFKEPSIMNILTPDTPFGLASNFSGYRKKKTKGDIPLHLVRGRVRDIGFVQRNTIVKNAELIDTWKVLAPGAGSDGGQKIPDVVLGKPWISSSPSVATQTFIAFCVDSKEEAKSVESYYRTKFFRHLVSLRKITQQASRPVYEWVPIQTWDRTWTDDDLYAKYALTADEISYIESVIQPMLDEKSRGNQK